MRNNSHKCTLLLKKANTLFSSSGVQFCCLNTDVSLSKNALYKKRRNDLFSQEKNRQHENIGRVEKIEVHYAGKPEDVTLVMNKDISTPFNCAQHMSEMLMRRSALALVDKTLWDMHRPLESGCQLELLHFKDPDPYHVNKAFWRTCSFLLGAVAEKIFKDNISVKLHSFPSPNVKSGSFVYDVDIGLDSWQPSEAELRIISGEMVKLCRQELKLERLSVDSELALEMFEDNRHKSQQIPHIASQISHDNKVILYRVGDHVDISRGPMVGDTSFVGRCTFTAVHKIETDQGQFYRFQGVALPKGFLLNHFAYGILEKRARNLNAARFPSNTNITESYTPTAVAL